MRAVESSLATGRKNGDRDAELKAAIEKIRDEIWKPGQTLPKLRRAIPLILQELKTLDDGTRGKVRQ
jgi:hypothetical protein